MHRPADLHAAPGGSRGDGLTRARPRPAPGVGRECHRGVGGSVRGKERIEDDDRPPPPDAARRALAGVPGVLRAARGELQHRHGPADERDLRLHVHAVEHPA
ncbi:hypothetical protein SBRY_20968 [Actinacidiphila bryophytorum]|uniref:Uncharacterized protein n=1 Tax=Actinacidiphila bryophytorum TaxID=1436133 RepID=A0A9W4E7J9_9ACTN|nr:hypothetical protein SBRY_20968 [Actinacidiphila bryophytorum]